MLTLVDTAMAQSGSGFAISQLEIELFYAAAVALIFIGFFFLLRKKIEGTSLSQNSEAARHPSPKDQVFLEPSAVDDVTEIKRDDQSSWIERLYLGLSRTRGHLKENLSRLLGGKKLDEDTLEQVQEVLFRSDLGVEMSEYLVESLRQRFGGRQEIPDWEDISTELRRAVGQALGSETERPLNRPVTGPMVVLVVGVNGVGKTTSIGKLAAHFVAEGQSVLLCAGDTFRAAAIDQLQIWADRLGIPIVKHQQGSDPASVAFDAVKAAKARNIDVLLIDTAGRLHSKHELMDELAKIKRVIGKELPEAPHETWLVIDATTGQNAVQQVKAFSELVNLSGLVVTKLDGTAKGGVIIGIKKRFNLPIRYIGVGEKARDLRQFSAQEFAESIFK